MNIEALAEALRDSVSEAPTGPPPLDEIHRAASRRRRGRAAGLMASAAVIVIAGGLSLSGDVQSVLEIGQGDQDEGPVLTLNETEGWPAAEVRGPLILREGCLLIGDNVALWPHGTTWNRDAESVRFDNLSIAVGAEVIGGGGFFGLGDLGGMSVVPEPTAREARECVEATNAGGIVMVYPTRVVPSSSRSGAYPPTMEDLLGTWQVSSMAVYDHLRGGVTDERVQPASLNVTFTDDEWRSDQGGCAWLSGGYRYDAGTYEYRDPGQSSGSRCPPSAYESEGREVANAANLMQRISHVSLSDGELHLQLDDFETVMTLTR